MKRLNSLLVLFSLSSGLALATDPAPALSSDPGVVAMISGVESDQHYQTLPPIMVEFDGLEQDERPNLWIELRKESTPAAQGGELLADARSIEWLDGDAILNVPGLLERCTTSDRWILLVRLKQGDEVVTLDRVPFHKADLAPQVVSRH